MILNIKDYKKNGTICELPLELEQEDLLISKFAKLLNGPITSLEEFDLACSDFDKFKKLARIDKVITHFGPIISEEKFDLIKEKFKEYYKSATPAYEEENSLDKENSMSMGKQKVLVPPGTKVHYSEGKDVA